jgi:aarF domain-containing kinase
MDEAALLLEQQLAGGSSSSQQPALEAQLVLLDFGLAEQLTDEVRYHFISFLNAISAGDGLCAARHLLRWSHTQACEDPRGFTSDVMDLFSDRCQISSEAGIDLDGVMKAVLGLARKWGVSIDSCYASLVISVCVLVGFAQALDPGVNIMDAVRQAWRTRRRT